MRANNTPGFALLKPRGLTIAQQVLATILLVPLQACAAESALVGTAVPPYPKEIVASHRGSCVPLDGSGKPLCAFSVSLLADAHRFPSHLSLERFDHRKSRTSFWLVVDVVPYPETPDGYEVQFGPCRLDGKDDPFISGAIMDGEHAGFEDVAWAVRIDISGGKLHRIPMQGVQCWTAGSTAD